MNKLFYLTSILFLLISCSEKLDEGFEEANGEVAEKLLKQVRIDYADPYEDDYTYQFGYDGKDRLSSITDGDNSSFFNYDSDGDLMSISGSDDPLEISELYESPYDAFEEGNVLEYDDKGNPKKIEVYDEGYNQTDIYIGEIAYDPNPNPFFYTLKAAGIIDVLNNVDLYFSASSPTVVKAYKLLPFNFIRSMIFKNSIGQVEAEVQYETTYDDDGYVTNTTITSIDEDGTEKIYLSFTYR